MIWIAAAIGIDVVGRRTFRMRQPRPATLFGKGQVEEVAALAEMHGAGLLIVDAALSPVQQKSLEEQVTKTLNGIREQVAKVGCADLETALAAV